MNQGDQRGRPQQNYQQHPQAMRTMNAHAHQQQMQQMQMLQQSNVNNMNLQSNMQGIQRMQMQNGNAMNHGLNQMTAATQGMNNGMQQQYSLNFPMAQMNGMVPPASSIGMQQYPGGNTAVYQQNQMNNQMNNQMKLNMVNQQQMRMNQVNVNQVNQQQVTVQQQQQQMHPNQRMTFAAQHQQQFKGGYPNPNSVNSVTSMQTNLNMQANVQSKLLSRNNLNGKASVVRNANHKKSGERSAASKYMGAMRRAPKKNKTRSGATKRKPISLQNHQNTGRLNVKQDAESIPLPAGSTSHVKRPLSASKSIGGSSAKSSSSIVNAGTGSVENSLNKPVSVDSVKVLPSSGPGTVPSNDSKSEEIDAANSIHSSSKGSRGTMPSKVLAIKTTNMMNEDEIDGSIIGSNHDHDDSHDDDEKGDSVESSVRRRIQQEKDMATNPYERRIKECGVFKCHKPKQPGLRANVFVSKDCTRDLAGHIVEEKWGNDFGMLYKYLDYIFRCQIFEKQVKQITFHYPSAAEEERTKPEPVVIFHTGLQRRGDHEFLYFVLKPNDVDKRSVAEQKWRVPAEDLTEYCFSAEELMSDKWGLSREHLPIRTKFYSDVKELLFDDSYPIEVNWPERLRTNKERIYQELKQVCPELDKGQMVPHLAPVFEKAMKMARKRARANPRLTVAQGFVETKNSQKRVELLLPLKIEYPENSGKITMFALALQRLEATEEREKHYLGMSLLTLSMAYANARLVGYVDSSWLGSDSIPKISYAEQKKLRKQEREEEQKRLQEEKQQREKQQSKLDSLQAETNQLRSENVLLTKKLVQQQQFYMQQHQFYMQQQQRQQVTAQTVKMPTPLGPHQHRQQWGQRQRRLQACRGSSRSKTQTQQIDFDKMDRMEQHQQRPFIDAPRTLQETISAPAHKHQQPKLNLNFAMDDMDADNALNDDVLLGIEGLNAASPASPGKELGRGFALPDEMEKELELEKVKFARSSPIRKDYVPLAKNSRTLQGLHHNMHSKPHVVHSHLPYTKVPAVLDEFAESFKNDQIEVRDTADIKAPTPNYSLDVAGNDHKYLLQLSCLPRDCGVRTLKDLFPGDCELLSVHLVVQEQTAVIRLLDEEQLSKALEFAKKSLKWHPTTIQDSQYLQFGDNEIVWQYQDSNRWIACHPAMGKLIDAMPNNTYQLIRHESRQYFIEKYNSSMGRQTNFRSGNQRSIRSVEIKVWAQHGDEEERNMEEDEMKSHDIAMTKFDEWMGVPTEPKSDGPEYQHTEVSRVEGSNRSMEGSVHVTGSPDLSMNENWTLCTSDDDETEAMATHCSMDDDIDHLTVWKWEGNQCDTVPSGLVKVEDVFYIPDAHDAALLFHTGTFGASDAKRVNLTICKTVEKAIELDTFDGEPDADGKIKVFMCNVYVDEEMEQQLEDDELEYCNLTNVQHIELVLCGMVNLEMLQEAVDV